MSLITRAAALYGMGDALNQRAFLITYCKQKHTPFSSIYIYTDNHWWMFEGLGFKRGKHKKNFNNLVAYRNFGTYNLPKTFSSPKLDLCIAKNAGIYFSFDTIVPLPKYKEPDIKLPDRFITFNTGYGKFSNNLSNPNSICTKEWPLEHWKKLVSIIGIPCVQIGSGPSCKIVDNSILNLVDKLTIQESAEVMRKSLFHIDMEGGLVILNQHLNKKSVVLFGPTAIENQGRSFNLNLRSNTCIPCYEWGSNKYSLGVDKSKLLCGAHCMKDLSPDYVAEQIYKNKWL